MKKTKTTRDNHTMHCSTYKGFGVFTGNTYFITEPDICKGNDKNCVICCPPTPDFNQKKGEIVTIVKQL